MSSNYLFLACLFALLPTLRAAERKVDASEAFFRDGAIPELRITLDEASATALRADARSYAKCSLVEKGAEPLGEVAIKLKGAAGSFRELDDRPAFTVNMDKYRPGQKFHGLDKFHLNNSVQDETLMHEAIGSELFRAAGVPAPRVTHARVWLNDRDLGLYVLKASFDKDFLKRHFTNSKGNLYDGGFCQEIDGELERDEGKAPDDRSDLAALADACKQENAEERVARLAERLNIEHFLTFTAMELCLGHWDGYVQNRNNYRVYFDPDDQGRARFLPHGMDQILGDPGASILNPPAALVASAVMQNPAWRASYRERVRELLPLFDAKEKMLPFVDKLEARLRPAVAALGEEAAQKHAERVNELRERISARAANLAEQAAAADPAPVAFDDQNRAATDGWTARNDSGNASLEDINEDGKPRRLLIAAGEGDPTLASWRATVLLAPGHYTLHGRARTEGLVPVEDEKGSGAGLRISGASRENSVSKDKAWTALAFEFTVEEQRHVELVAELRATAGKVWFEAGSLQLERRP